MATHAPMARVPFAPLDNPRLQHLASAKNRQNGLVSALKSSSNGKSVCAMTTTLTSPTKRPFEPALFDDFDAENIDPSSLTSPSKKSKSDEPSAKQSFAFTFASSTAAASMPPPARLSTPLRTTTTSTPRAPMTAPAGRSPKRKILGSNKPRRTSAPFSRIDPPSFAGTRPSSLPFSLDAALNGTLSGSPPAAVKAEPAPMPKTWFFEIYEDTPEEEAANLMEHSTLTLDLSSDDEAGSKKRDDRGKENTPPEGYDAPAASLPVVESIPDADANATVKSAEKAKTRRPAPLERRRKLDVDAMDDGLRSPLAELETESVVVVGKEGEVKGEIIIWEDAGEVLSGTTMTVEEGEKTKE